MNGFSLTSGSMQAPSPLLRGRDVSNLGFLNIIGSTGRSLKGCAPGATLAEASRSALPQVAFAGYVTGHTDPRPCPGRRGTRRSGLERPLASAVRRRSGVIGSILFRATSTSTKVSERGCGRPLQSCTESLSRAHKKRRPEGRRSWAARRLPGRSGLARRRGPPITLLRSVFLIGGRHSHGELAGAAGVFARPPAVAQAERSRVAASAARRTGRMFWLFDRPLLAIRSRTVSHLFLRQLSNSRAATEEDQRGVNGPLGRKAVAASRQGAVSVTGQIHERERTRMDSFSIRLRPSRASSF